MSQEEAAIRPLPCGRSASHPPRALTMPFLPGTFLIAPLAYRVQFLAPKQKVSTLHDLAPSSIKALSFFSKEPSLSLACTRTIEYL